MSARSPRWTPNKEALASELRRLRRLMDQPVPRLIEIRELARAAEQLVPSISGLEGVMAAVSLACDRLPRDAWLGLAERLYGLTPETRGKSFAYRRDSAYTWYCELQTNPSGRTPSKETFRTGVMKTVSEDLATMLVELVADGHETPAAREPETPWPDGMKGAALRPLPSLVPDAIPDSVMAFVSAGSEERDHANGPAPALGGPPTAVAAAHSRSSELARRLRTPIAGIVGVTALAFAAMALVLLQGSSHETAQTGGPYTSFRQGALVEGPLFGASSNGLTLAQGHETPAATSSRLPRLSSLVRRRPSRRSRSRTIRRLPIAPVRAYAAASQRGACSCQGAYESEAVPYEPPSSEEEVATESPPPPEGPETAEPTTSESSSSTETSGGTSSSTSVSVNGSVSSEITVSTETFVP